MIKKIFTNILYLLLFCYMLIVFLPKLNLYYLGLEKLETYKVTILSSDQQENSFSLDLKNLAVYYNNINVATVNDISLSTYLYSSKIEVQTIKANDVLKEFIPEFVKELVVTHSVFNPLEIKIDAFFKKGRAFGYVDIIEKRVSINLDVSNAFIKKYKNLTKQFKKNGKYYTYEFKY